jgi:hypothetical protein
MKTTYKFKAKYLNKILWRLVIIGLAISLLIFIGLDIDLIYRYFISMMIIFVGILIVFYLNKNEIEQLNIEDEKLELIYFNKVFFKSKPSNYLKLELNIKSNDDIIELYKDNKLISNIRNESTVNDDWDKLKSYFKVHIGQ